MGEDAGQDTVAEGIARTSEVVRMTVQMICKRVSHSSVFKVCNSSKHCLHTVSMSPCGADK